MKTNSLKKVDFSVSGRKIQRKSQYYNCIYTSLEHFFGQFLLKKVFKNKYYIV